MKKLIIPSIIAQSQEELDNRINKVKDHAPMLQLDFFDGTFVPSKSFEFDFQLPKGTKYEADLLINNPEKWIEKHGEKFDTILVHVQTAKDPMEIIRLVNAKGKRVGFALDPENSLDDVKPYLDKLDQLLVMTVNPGFYGSKFLPQTLKKVEQARKLKPDLDIEVDGGITADTIGLAARAGANLFISGSYLQNAQNVKEAMDTLKELIGGD